MTPAAMPLWTVRMMFPKMFVRMCEIIQILGAGGLVAVPSYAELAGPAAADVATYFQAANADAATRIKLFRLAFDAAVSSFSGRQQLYERYYSGDPVRLAGTLYGLYDKDTHIDRIIAMLDELEARSPSPGRGGGLGRRYPPARASISASSGNRPSCFFEKTSFPSMVISNTPDTPLTSSTSSAPRSMSLAFARRARGS